MTSPSSSTPKITNTPKLSGHGTARHTPNHSLSGVSAAKAALARSTATGLNRRPTLSSIPSSASPEEREKAVSLKAEYDGLLAAAEEREAVAAREAHAWKTRASELAEQIARVEADLARLTETDDQLGKLSKELERARSLAKDHELQLIQQNEEFDAARTIWAEAENELKGRINALAAELAQASKPHSPPPVNPDGEHEQKNDGEPGEIDFQRSPAFRAPATAPSPATTGRSTLELEAALAEARKEASEAEGLRRAIGVLRDQLADAERVNEQLMDDNESYQFLVGERTLMGGFDIKQLLRVDSETPASASGSSLADVEEEEEEEEDEEMDDIERAVLESHGNGSRTTGAVEAEVSTTRHKSKSAASAIGGGLDLAAELAQAEQSEELEKTEERRKKKSSTGRSSTKDKDAEIKFLTDANKALVLYISKILDRIQAHEGFEKVLATDYKKEPSPMSSPSKGAAAAASSSPATSTGIASTFLNALTNKSSSSTADRKPLNLAGTSSTGSAQSAPRASWLQFFTASKSPSANANIKPLKLGTTQAGFNGGWQAVGAKEGDEDEEDVRERERLRAELKLHGIDKTTSPTLPRAATLDGSTRASRRSSSLYGAGSITSSGGKRMSAEQVVMGSPPPMTPAAALKRSEERERESKANLEKGQASGFTEIEIRGSRLRPAGHQRLSGTVSPTSCALSGGMKDLKICTPTETTPPGPASASGDEGILARTAKRISLMRS
ncbi:hypothetical protein CROQUDRAFT_91778 [Cronartium quercuum f. sp. fusiforme G11]|uniref:Uncharacterized protein n=1 Tax=Cronartium quercuum f. sp. fusiforme G11 TaxID=708437 RepID=A0A9P6NPB1_9BASI|nr:hypothetical protein CROQUDRAFT_91778 [Cronartium quercuum f. sp. fusiforme G11]